MGRKMDEFVAKQ
jgi:chromosome segregation ATPase